MCVFQLPSLHVSPTLLSFIKATTQLLIIMAPPPPITHWLRRAPLGSGSFGCVSLAINLDNGVFFAVKSTPCSPESESFHALEKELCILQSLESPRIVSCYGGDYSWEDGLPSRNIFLEYVDGGSLAQLVQRYGGRLDEARAQSYTRGIVEGLVYLHEQGIVHCDIKGHNILVGSSGIKIADFGAAKKLGSCQEEGPCESKGTPLWMAPEVLQGVEQGCASDIWSLGCTVVEMLQGRPPWSGQGSHPSSSTPSPSSCIASVLYKIACSTESLPLPKGLSADCRDFLSKSLHRNPKLRWTAAQLLDHPWLKDAPETIVYSEQPSPRSTLDFLAESDEDEQDTLCSTPVCHVFESLETEHVYRPNAGAICVPMECKWVTVRCTSEWQEIRQKPFMEQPWKLHPLMKGGVVNFDTIAFLLLLQKRRNMG